MGGIYFILKPFGGESTLGFSSTATRGDRKCDWTGRNTRRRHRWRIWGILNDRIIRIGDRDLMRRRLERILQTKGILGGLIGGMNVVLTLNEPVFILPFSSSDSFIMKYSTITRFQRYLMSEWVKGNVVPEYWGVFIIIDRLNVTEGVIKQHVILRGNIPCGKVQDQRNVNGMSRTINNKYATPGLWLLVEKLFTLWHF